MPVPTTTRAVMVHTLSSNFRAATGVTTVALPPLPPRGVAVRMIRVGVNASDVNTAAGVYRPGHAPPLPVGFEGMGIVEAVGGAVRSAVRPADVVVTRKIGAFAEWQICDERSVRVVPTDNPAFLALEISGVTAALAVEKGGATEGMHALVTAAAGGVGHIAVQLLKRAGCRVVGTCSTEDKEELLEILKCDVVLNVKNENYNEALETAFPGGIDLAVESVGGKMLDATLEQLAHHGTIVSLGSISGYADGSSWRAADGAGGSTYFASKLLSKSGTLRGLFLPHYAKRVPEIFASLAKQVEDGSLRCIIDPKNFVGLESIADAVEFLYSRKSFGKIVVDLP